MSRSVSAIAFGGLLAVGYAVWRNIREKDQQPQFVYVPTAAPSSNGTGGSKAAAFAPLIDWGIGALFDGLGGVQAGQGASHSTTDLDALLASLTGTSATGYQVDRAPLSGGTGPGGIDFGTYEGKYGLPTGYLHRTAQIESAMNPAAQNPRSSAGGLFQFINSTAKAYGLSDRFNPTQATDAASRLARDNANYLRKKLGREPTAAELYLAHQQGAGGAGKLLSNPNGSAVNTVGSAAIKLNGGNSNMTNQQFANLWIDKFNRGYGV